ncbi:MAG: histidine kinase [bacterium]|nr:histidine kinase [bacterium]
MSTPSTSRSSLLGRIVGTAPTNQWLLDLGVAALWAISFAISYIFFERNGVALGTWILLPTLTAAVLLRRVNPTITLLVALLAPPAIRFLEFGMLRDTTGAEIQTHVASASATPYLDIFALGILVYTVGARIAPAWAIGWWLLTAFVIVAVTALFGHTETRVGDGVFNELFTLVALLVGMNVRANRQRSEAMEQRAHQLELERDQREQLAVSRERARIAREMHDVVAHSLTVMVTLAEGALASLGRNPEGARRAIEELGAAGRSALSDTRRLVGVLRDDGPSPAVSPSPSVPGDDGAPFTPQPTSADIAGLVERFRSTGLDVTFAEWGPPLPADAGLHLTIYRIVQEALTNVLRHAKGSPAIDVSIARSRRAVVVEVENEAGPEGEPQEGTGKGLIGMRERAAVYDGTVEAGPTATGWKVRAVLYWQEER